MLLLKSISSTLTIYISFSIFSFFYGFIKSFNLLCFLLILSFYFVKSVLALVFKNMFWFYLLYTEFLMLIKCYNFYCSVKMLCLHLLKGNSDSLSPDNYNISFPTDYFVFSSIVNVLSRIGFFNFSILCRSFDSFFSSNLNYFGVEY
jgi:hypothetical protein